MFGRFGEGKMKIQHDCKLLTTFEKIKCSDLKDGKCHYPADYCKYNPPEPCFEDMEDAMQEIATLRKRIKELEADNDRLHDKNYERVSRTAYDACVGSVKDAKRYWVQAEAENEQLRKRVKDLEAYKAEFIETFGMIMAEKCPSGDYHCGCVPILRFGAKQLEAEVRMLEDEVDRLHDENEALRDENECLRQVDNGDKADLAQEIDHSRFLEKLLEALLGEQFDKITLHEAGKLRHKLLLNKIGEYAVAPGQT
jgi:cell division protein FtsB